MPLALLAGINALAVFDTGEGAVVHDRVMDGAGRLAAGMATLPLPPDGPQDVEGCAAAPGHRA